MMTSMDKFKIINEMYETAEKLRGDLFSLRAKVCKHPESARTVTEINHWSSWPDYGTDPGIIRCEDCNTKIGETWGSMAPKTGKKT